MARFRSAIPGLIAVAVFSLSVPAMAGQSVPIKGTLDCHNTIVSGPLGPGLDDFYLVIDGSATGNVSHLGKTSAGLVFDLGFVVVGVDASGNPIAIPQDFIGTITFKAANGDILRATFVGKYDYPGSSTFTATITFKGGKGRFQDASGSATLTGEDTDPSGLEFLADFQGSIAY